MNLEKYFEDPAGIVLLERWLAAPADSRPEVPAALADQLERLQRAHKYLLIHHSKRIAWQSMHAFYTGQGRKYSEVTARNDVNDAERLFILVSPYTGPFLVVQMMDSLYERYMSAVRAGDHNAAKGYSSQLDKYIDRHDKYVRERADAINDPIPIIGLFDLSEAGVP